jgi:hypothetical protein
VVYLGTFLLVAHYVDCLPQQPPLSKCAWWASFHVCFGAVEANCLFFCACVVYQAAVSSPPTHRMADDQETKGSLPSHHRKRFLREPLHIGAATVSVIRSATRKRIVGENYWLKHQLLDNSAEDPVCVCAYGLCVCLCLCMFASTLKDIDPVSLLCVSFYAILNVERNRTPSVK